ncbi:insulinase family protein [Paenibacillus polymyxa]|uniref:insulinase family protein n=1 Tax=Paenibacillus polymyxa TaxID=1406 RepID=UPI0025B72CEB|nr:insulinase family protein [Paenibacillus polymyxa]MDN4090796.1 insulinase family protein [Paenibacillus polymyxa]
MQTILDLKSYRILEIRNIEELKSEGVVLEHLKTGARLVLLSNEDENKVFSIGFRTPSKDDNGVAHILEHSVLCGSRKFPAKDTFAQLLKGSLNTFLNAMTFSDKTIYPVASKNEKDFQNLMDIYMDAVLYPNIYRNKEIFHQEGWSYYLESADSELQYNGVVYNEMKGEFSSPERVLYRNQLNSLFPDSIYSKEYGGLPEEVLKLKYEDMLAYHTKYYHPSNSYIYLYGKMDMVEKLEWLDQEYLSAFERLEIDSRINLQPAFNEQAYMENEYSINMHESEVDNTFLSYNAVIGTNLDRELSISFQVLHYALIGASGAPLRQALLKTGIAKNILGTYMNSMVQPVFSITAQQSNEEHLSVFLDTIQRTLRQITTEGIHRDFLLAGLNSYEFNYREADFGRFPKGLNYGIQIIDSLIHEGNNPFISVETNKIFERLHAKLSTRYFEELIEQYLMNNSHTSVVVLKPRRGLGLEQEEALKARTREYQQKLNDHEIQHLLEQTAALKAYQSIPSTKEQLDTIPMLSRDEIATYTSHITQHERIVDDTLVLHQELYTNGIGYLRVLFDLGNIPEDLLEYAGILEYVLGKIDTENYCYSTLSNQIGIHSGGIYTGLAVYTSTKQFDEFKPTFEFSAKIMYEKLDFALYVIEEMMLHSKLNDSKRLYEIIREMKSDQQMYLISSGHVTAQTRTLSYHSRSGYFRDLISGVAHYQLVSKLEAHFDERKDQLISKLQELCKAIFRPENMIISYTSDAKGYALLESRVQRIKSNLHVDVSKEDQVSGFTLVKKNEGFVAASQVQYVAQTGNFLSKGYVYTGALKVLKTILSYEYLWNEIRVKGGAYGASSNFQRNGDMTLSTYRDPNLKTSYDAFMNIPDYIRQFNSDEQNMTRYIIGTIRELDVPNSPANAGYEAMSLYLCGFTNEDVQRERNEILSTNAEEIVRLAPIVEEMLNDHYICVVGNEAKLQSEEGLFHELVNL